MDYTNKKTELELMIVNYEIYDFEDKGNYKYIVCDYIDFIAELYKVLRDDIQFRESFDKVIRKWQEDCAI